jgi:hypothetical protein
MSMQQVPCFPAVDEYLGVLLGADLWAVKRGRTAVVESADRLRAHLSYGFIHALWWVWLEDGRSVASVPPGAGPEVEKVAGGVREAAALFSPSLAEELKAPVTRALSRAGAAPVDRVLCDLMFAGNASLLRRHHRGDCRRLIDASIPPAEGLELPTQCFPDGVVYGVVEDAHVGSVAYAHRTGLMEDRIADLGVETAPGYRRRGYAQTAVSAVVGEITGRGGEGFYKCSPTNLASIATARSVGFLLHAKGLVLAAPRAPKQM